ncbi:hypothetical protein HQ520_13100 [bacterium]|nr:hypothetical protein [bacterium]
MKPRTVQVYGRNSSDLLPRLKELRLEIDETDPDVVISYGGDGTLLAAERRWPGVPKVALRDSLRCRTCSHISNEALLRHLADGKLKRNEFLKLRCEAKGHDLTCINDVILRNPILTAGVRYRVWIDDEAYGEDEIVGDGLVVATPFGSSAYYRSITHSTFRVGIGLAFNNSIEPINHLVLANESVIRVQITRGPAALGGDNNPDIVPLDRGDEVVVHRADHCATILVFDRVRYPADQFIFFQNNSEEPQ